MKKPLIIAASALLVFSCNQADPNPIESKTATSERSHSTEKKGKTAYEMEAPPEGGFAMAPSSPKDDQLSNRKLIWDGNLRFKVSNIDNSTRRINVLCDKFEGYISEMNRNATEYEITNDITIRVANEHFHKLVDAIKGESVQMEVASVTSEDMTEEFVDIESRLKTKREVRERYIQILRSKTGTIAEIIEAEEAIRRITEEIEAKEGRLRYLQDQVDYSTIQLSMYQTVSVKHEVLANKQDTYSDRAQSSFASGWHFVQSVGLGLIAIWPLLIVVGIVVYLKRKWLKRLFGRHRNSQLS